MIKKIVVGGDHAGFSLKQTLIDWLTTQGYEVKDVGAYSESSVDYPDFAHAVALAVESGQYSTGILICGSGQGVAITANKHQQIRAALVWDEPLAELARQHNNANVLCLPARFMTSEKAIACVSKFLATDFEGGRHVGRLEKMGC